VFTATRDAYGWTLALAMRFHGVTMAVSALLLVGTIYCFRIIPTGFIPSQDMGQINGSIEAMQGIGFEAMAAHAREVSRVIRANPNVAAATANVGGGGGGAGTLNNGRVTVDLKPRAERELSADQLIEQLRPQLAQIPGVRVILQNRRSSHRRGLALALPVHPPGGNTGALRRRRSSPTAWPRSRASSTSRAICS
jgi:HAE1 family hydrophobic/amphiphilic exporter-1